MDTSGGQWSPTDTQEIKIDLQAVLLNLPPGLNNASAELEQVRTSPDRDFSTSSGRQPLARLVRQAITAIKNFEMNNTT